MTIVSHCSYSGTWVKECIKFLDEQEVAPCGHSARDKGILIKVYTSCLSHQIPRHLAYSSLCLMNDKNTGIMMFTKQFHKITLESIITDNQHVRGIDFTEVKCGQKSISDNCLCLSRANWITWSKRIYTVRGNDKGRKAWHLLLVNDDDETILHYVERTQGDNAGRYTITLSEYGEVLRSGWGEAPSEEEKELVFQKYESYRKKNHTSED